MWVVVHNIGANLRKLQNDGSIFNKVRINMLWAREVVMESERVGVQRWGVMVENRMGENRQHGEVYS